MNRRKGETTGRMNEREFPHIVELAVPPGGFQDQDLEFDAFHRERGIRIRCGSGHQEDGQFYVRFCFPSAAHAHAFRDRFGGEYLTYPPRKFSKWITRRTRYESPVFAGRIVIPDELERIHKEILGFERIDTISDEMRALVEERWPELVHKLPLKGRLK